MKYIALSGLLALTALAACNYEDRGDGSGDLPESEIQQGFVPVDGGQIFYEETGLGDPIILIHGNAGDRRHWDRQFDYLSSEFRVIRYDVRGFGKSSLPVIDVPYSDSTDLVALLDYLKIHDAHIVGWSMGSGIAFDFATAYPERTKTLTSVGPWVNGYSSTQVDALYEQMGAVANAVAEGGVEAGTAAFMDIVLADTIRQESSSVFMEQIALDYSWWAFLNSSPAEPMEPSAASVLDQLSVPIFVVTAEYDLEVCREIGELIVASVPGSRRSVMSETGHLMHIERPQEFNALLIDFLRAERR